MLEIANTQTAILYRTGDMELVDVVVPCIGNSVPSPKEPPLYLLKLPESFLWGSDPEHLVGNHRDLPPGIELLQDAGMKGASHQTAKGVHGEHE